MNMDLDLAERIARLVAWIVAIIAGIVTTIKNLSELKDKKKARKSKSDALPPRRNVASKSQGRIKPSLI